MDIVTATAEHVPGIVEVWLEMMDFHRDIDPIFSRNEGAADSFAKYLTDSLELDNAQILAVLENDRVIAFSLALITKYPPVLIRQQYGLISDISVRAAHRRRGIGSKLISHIMVWFEEKDIDRIELRAAVNNHSGYSFWRKHGFQDYLHIMYRER